VAHIAEAAYRDKAPVDVETLVTQAIDEIQKHVDRHGSILGRDAKLLALRQI
jgi:hypothetical protein